ncbi:MAG: hypothetical protein KCHDKBKB_02299 [Elusimicrobia bacterium]|nr:hypothetical protein [Elusimicrobiota bacterium]
MRIGFGYSSHPDHFQRGREAAQSVKQQLHESSLQLVLVFAPSTLHFKDYVEGARLIIGEDCLVAVPVTNTFSNETNIVDTGYVIGLQTSNTQISIGSLEMDSKAIWRGSTSLISSFRHHRGNALREFSNRGCLVFTHNLQEAELQVANTLGIDLGLESWLIGTSTSNPSESPLICLNRTIKHGMLGIEFLSHSPWGLGSVAVGAFGSHQEVLQEATKTALREAAAHMQDAPPCLGLLIYDFNQQTNISNPLNNLAPASHLLPNIPLLGFSTTNLFIRRTQRTVPQLNDTVIALLVPA